MAGTWYREAVILGVAERSERGYRTSPQGELRAFSERGKEGKPLLGHPQTFPGRVLRVEPQGSFSPGFFEDRLKADATGFRDVVAGVLDNVPQKKKKHAVFLRKCRQHILAYAN